MSTTVTPEQGSSQAGPEWTPSTSSTQSSSTTTRQTLEGRRLRQRVSLLLGQQTGLSRVMLVVLTGALVFGLIGFAAHILWIVAVIIIALGLGYVAAGSRRGGTDAVDQR
jgi:hypothetical protein